MMHPKQFIITLGYAGWDQGQLEQELIDNTWLNVPADPDLIFNTPAIYVGKRPSRAWVSILISSRNIQDMLK